jgi:hypothetical protein
MNPLEMAETLANRLVAVPLARQADKAPVPAGSRSDPQRP